METITDYAGNTFAASRLNEQESPGFDPWGARKDRAWQTLGKMLQDETAKLPVNGDTVTITQGRKHKGKVGEVFWVGRDAFDRSGRYGDEMLRAFARAGGAGMRIGVRTVSGDKFFVPMKYAQKGEVK